MPWLKKGWGNRNERKRLTGYIITGMVKLNDELNTRDVKKPTQLIELIQDPINPDNNKYKQFKEACEYLDKIKKIPTVIADMLPPTPLTRQDGKRKLDK